jgi:hypothetical protein
VWSIADRSQILRDTEWLDSNVIVSTFAHAVDGPGRP